MLTLSAIAFADVAFAPKPPRRPWWMYLPQKRETTVAEASRRELGRSFDDHRALVPQLVRYPY